jgi:hypothetical protein
MWRRGQRNGNEPRARLAGHSGRTRGIFRCSTRFTPRDNAASANRTVVELNRRKNGRRGLLLADVIGKVAKLILNCPEMIVNPSVVTLSVVLQPMQILEKAVDVICDDNTGGSFR